MYFITSFYKKGKNTQKWGLEKQKKKSYFASQ